MSDTYVFSARIPLRRWLVAVALGLFWLNASAFRLDKSAELAWSQTGNSATGSLSRGAGGPLSTSSLSGGVGVGGGKSLPWPGKSQAENMAKWKTLATPANLAKSLANPTSLLLLAGTLALAPLLDGACVRVMGGSMEVAPGGQWEQCRYVDRTFDQYFVDGYPGTMAGTPESACYKWSEHRWPINSEVYQTSPGAYGFCTGYFNGSYVAGTSIQKGPSVTQKERDGWKPATTAEVEEAVKEKLTTWTQADFTAGRLENDPQAQAQPVLRELLDRGQSVEVTPTPTVTGPATVQGNPKVEKVTEPKPDGTGTREKTTTTQTTYNYTYNDNRVTQTTTTTVTNTYSDGTPAEETVKEETDERTACEKDPKAFGCGELDTPEGEIPKSTKELTYAPESIGASGGSCPPDVVRTIQGKTLTLFSYQSGCGYLSTYIKPLVLLISALIAYFLLIPGGPGRVES